MNQLDCLNEPVRLPDREAYVTVNLIGVPRTPILLKIAEVSERTLRKWGEGSS